MLVALLKSYFANTFNFTGRISRKDYWLTVLFLIIFSLVVGIIAGIILAVFIILSGSYETKEYLILSLIMFPVILPCFALQVRRLHDINWSGLLVGASFLYYIFETGYQLASGKIKDPFYFPQSFDGNYSFVAVLELLILSLNVFLFLLTLLKGTDGANKYGEVPTPIYKKKTT